MTRTATPPDNSAVTEQVAPHPYSAASYIADITTELAGIARRSQLDVLAYLLDIAQLEATKSARRLAAERRSR
ncbi:MAG: hypothetical protein JWR08_2136 [Enterovirga sp.]|jgi:hypothetical protein|nr:hypothetical protein [Enterovirga sp.]